MTSPTSSAAPFVPSPHLNTPLLKYIYYRVMIPPTLFTLILVLFSISSSATPAKWIQSYSPRGHFRSDGIANFGFDTPSRVGYGYRLPAVGSGEGSGWMARWLNVGGEGEVNVLLNNGTNLTLPHRPSAFPSHLSPPTTLPLSGTLQLFTSLPTPPNHSNRTNPRAQPNQACVPSSTNRYITPHSPYTIALVERGSCDFAMKVKAAQDRGVAGVIVGDGVGRVGESDEEGMDRVGLITMFSPEDTENIHIPSVFVSRSSYLLLKDLILNSTDSSNGGLQIEVSEGEDEGGTLSSLLSFALLLPSIFLLATIAIHRIRAARQQEADRAPPLVVLSLPERIWTPDISWEKSSSSSSSTPTTPTPRTTHLPPPPPISPSEITSPSLHPQTLTDEPLPIINPGSSSRGKKRTKSGVSKKYFGKDECAICMENFVRGEVVRLLPCGHVFHKDECDEWLMKWRKLCPTCRADVTLPVGQGGDEGSRMTRVSDPTIEGGDEPERGTLADRARELYRAARRRLVGGSEGVNETTPLIARHEEGTV